MAEPADLVPLMIIASLSAYVIVHDAPSWQHDPDRREGHS